MQVYVHAFNVKKQIPVP